MIKGLNASTAWGIRCLFVGVCLLLSAATFAQEAAANQLKNIDFRINKDKAAVLIVELASASAVVDVQKTEQGLTIELLKTDVSDDKLYLVDVRDFATAVENIEVFR